MELLEDENEIDEQDINSDAWAVVSSGIEFIEFELNILSKAMPVVRSFFLNSSTKISDNFSPPEGKINENRDNKDSERFTDFTRVTFTVLKGLKIEK